MIGLSEMFKARGFEPDSNRAKLVRHTEAEVGAELLQGPWLDYYQKYQQDPIFDKCDQIIVFVGEERSKSRFIGVYDVGERMTADEAPSLPAECPRPEWAQGGFYYPQVRRSGFEDLEGRLIIDWGKDPINWHKPFSDRPVIEIRPLGRTLPPFRDYLLVKSLAGTCRTLVVASALATNQWVGRVSDLPIERSTWRDSMMRRHPCRGFICAVVALAVTLNGCGGGAMTAGGSETALTPLSTQRLAALAMRNYVQRPVHPDHARSRMRRDTGSSPLLYVGDQSTNDVFVYDYPSGTAVGTLTGFNAPYGMCVDATGDVFITNSGSGTAVEYAHGGTSPIKTYSPGGNPIGCSVDANGDVAITSFDPGEVTVYAAGSSSEGTTYSSPCSEQWTMGYDDSSNLIGVGTASSATLACALLSGASTVTTLSTSGITIDAPGGTQWDGKYIALGDQEAGGTKQTGVWPSTLSGSILTAASSEVTFSDTCYSNYTDDVNPFFVGKTNVTPGGSGGQATAMVGPNLWCNTEGSSKVDYWAYPAGGSPTGNLSSPPSEPYGAAVSVIGKSGVNECIKPVSPKDVGRCHLTIIQTLVEYFPQIKAATGLEDPPPRDKAAEVFFRAALKVPQISSKTKELIRYVAANYKSIRHGKISPYCETAETQFESGLQTAIGSNVNFTKILSYLKNEQNMYSSCAGFSLGVQSAIDILIDGESTIYNPKWYKKLGGPPDVLERQWEPASRAPRAPNGAPAPGPVKDIIGETIAGDLGGATTGAVAGALGAGAGALPGALIGGAAGSAGGLVVGLFKWVWGK